MDTFWSVFGWIGVVESVLFVGGLAYGAYLWLSGVSTALLRLGNGLAKREIAIFAKGNNMSSLKSLLTDSRLFKTKNISEITKSGDIGRAESATIFLVFWQDWKDEIGQILDKKADECALIVYAPTELGRIPDQEMNRLDGTRHTAVTNFRGRLLADIVASMITTSYEGG